MTKKNWFKHKESGEVFYREGYTRANAVVVRDRDRKLKWVSMTDFRSWYTPADVSGFPSLKPKPPVPAAEQFGPGPWYGYGLTYRQASFQEDYGFYVFNSKTKEHVGWGSYEVVRHLWGLGMVNKEGPRSTESIVGQASAVMDLAKMATIRPKDVKPKKKVLVEWAIQMISDPGEFCCRFFPEGYTPNYNHQKHFKTGRAVEVPE